jgi:hypothetical protein
LLINLTHAVVFNLRLGEHYEHYIQKMHGRGMKNSFFKGFSRIIYVPLDLYSIFATQPWLVPHYCYDVPVVENGKLCWLKSHINISLFCTFFWEPSAWAIHCFLFGDLIIKLYDWISILAYHAEIDVIYTLYQLVKNQT